MRKHAIVGDTILKLTTKALALFALAALTGVACVRVQHAAPAKAATAPAPAPEAVNGFAAVSADGVETTTGGGNAPPVTVKTGAELAAVVRGTTPRVVIVSGTIKTTDLNNYALEIGSNITIRGIDKDATIYGGIDLTDVSNVIIQNISFHGVHPNPGPDDAVSLHNSHHVWLDHLNIWDAGDGNLDITYGSSYVTVSWCKFWYTDPNHPHRLSCLIGSGAGDHPADWGRLKVTYHHNWFSDLVKERMPRLMYGQGHTYNNYYTCKGNLYCIGVGSYGSMLIENNYFKQVKDPHVFMYEVLSDIVARGNVYDNVTGKKDNGHGGFRDAPRQDGFEVQPFTTPPYPYKLDAGADVPALVSAGAGPHTWPAAPSAPPAR